jgi:hypothetical protein
VSAAALRDLLAEAEREMARILARLEVAEGGKRLDGDQEALRVADRVRREAVSALSRLEVITVDAVTQTLIKEAQAELRRIGPTSIEPRAQQRIEAALGPIFDGVADAFGRAKERVARGVLVGVVGGRNFTSVVADIQQTLGGTFAQAQTALATGQMALSRVVVTTQAEAAAKKVGVTMRYRYTGPRGSILRPFCSEHLGKIYTLEELDQLDNGPGQPKPVSSFLGGYNCRHRLAPVLGGR